MRTDSAGQRFGRLTVIKFLRANQHRQSVWQCVCDCGNVTEVFLNNLRSGGTQSCGCLQREAVSQANTTHGQTQGYTQTVEYRTWSAMISRCTNPELDNYKDYGGRGITVCDRWRNSFEAFLEDMGFRPSENHSLDRHPNVNGNYEPGNCRWATRIEQQNNRRNSRFYEVENSMYTARQLSEKYGVSDFNNLNSRLKKGWDLHRAMTQPVIRRTKD